MIGRPACSACSLLLHCLMHVLRSAGTLLFQMDMGDFFAGEGRQFVVGAVAAYALAVGDRKALRLLLRRYDPEARLRWDVQVQVAEGE